VSAEALAFGERREPALLPAFVLATLVHLFLAAVMFLGVHWQSHPPETVVVELWEAPPPPAPVVEAPTPPPPKAEPEPTPVQKPDIAVKAPQKPKPKPEPKPAPKKDVEFQKRLNEQLAQEQRAIDEQRREAERREAAARQQAIAAAARDRALAAWVDKIRAKIRGNIHLPSGISGNPEAIFDVTQLPTGEVISGSIRLRKSSGHKGYDDAVERAILKSSPLPKPDQPSLFERQLELRFRPQDK
jgi:colicin import membrane protein